MAGSWDGAGDGGIGIFRRGKRVGDGGTGGEGAGRIQGRRGMANGRMKTSTSAQRREKE